MKAFHFFLFICCFCLFYQNTIISVEAQVQSLIRVMGRLTDHVITSREVEMDKVVEEVLFDKQTPPIKSHVDQVLLEWAIYKEAQAFAVSKVSHSKTRSMIKQFRSQLESNPSLLSQWSDLKVLNSELQVLVRRKWRAKKFMEFKQQSSLVPITDEEASNYYQKRRDEYEETDFSAVSQKIKDKLSRERAERRIQQWHKDLKNKYKLMKN